MEKKGKKSKKITKDNLFDSFFSWKVVAYLSSSFLNQPSKVVNSFMDSPLLNVLITDICFGAKLNKKIEKKTFFKSKKISMIKTYDMETFACQKWFEIKAISELGPRCSQN